MTVEEAKFYPTGDLEPVPLEPGELPSSYGRNRLVLLPVDPYLLYAYWELAADPPPSAGARAVLRFHETPLAIQTEVTRPFDVDIELGAGNWYVHLWSPEKEYFADLGLRGEDGALVSLARSNTVRTPPAGPVERASAGSETNHSESREPDPEPAPQTDPTRVDAAALLRSKLEELFAIRGELPPMPEPYDVSEFTPPEATEFDEVVPFDLDDLEALDLTAYTEQRFTPGISSGGGPLDQ